jgi:phage gp16-like protein
MTAAKRKPKDPLRARHIKAIHAMARELALAEDTYRAIISRHSGGRTDSSAALRADERTAVMDYLRGLGAGRKAAAPEPSAVPLPSGAPAHRRGRRPLAQTAWARKLRALWLALYHLGEVSEPSEDALAAFVERQTRVDGRGVDALQWLSPDQARLVIEALKAWCARAGCEVGDTRKDGGWQAKRTLARAIWSRLAEVGAVRIAHPWALDAWLNPRIVAHNSSIDLLTLDQLDRTAEQLGEWLRSAMARQGIQAPLSAHIRGREA